MNVIFSFQFNILLFLFLEIFVDCVKPGEEQHHKEHQKVQLVKDKQHSKIQNNVIAKKEFKKHKLEHSNPSTSHQKMANVGEKTNVISNYETPNVYNEFEYHHHVVDMDNYDQAFYDMKNDYENHFLDQVSAKLDKDIDNNKVDDNLLSVKQKELEDALIVDKKIKDSGS
uniref:Uncharacterized protein n=1 Tax=Meloidogyne enterolobii TaxID=390850 RepID=A0A6V7URN4_MELEN|nr:unnamed protein product [Meloidogyne enterolobii]